jgi:hypothetical protein
MMGEIFTNSFLLHQHDAIGSSFAPISTVFCPEWLVTFYHLSIPQAAAFQAAEYSNS